MEKGVLEHGLSRRFAHRHGMPRVIYPMAASLGGIRMTGCCYFCRVIVLDRTPSPWAVRQKKSGLARRRLIKLGHFALPLWPFGSRSGWPPPAWCSLVSPLLRSKKEKLHQGVNWKFVFFEGFFFTHRFFLDAPLVFFILNFGGIRMSCLAWGLV